MAEGEIERRLAAVVAIDVAGYSRLMGVDEDRTLAALKRHRDATMPIGEKHGGRMVGTAGDGELWEFPSVTEAVQSAIEVQEAMAERNADVPDEEKMLYRIGINLGDVMIDGDDIYGDGINVALRIEGLADPGGICLSRTVRDSIGDRLHINLEDLGDVEVKNIARPVRIFRVLGEGEQASAPARRNGAIRFKSVIAFVIVLALVAGGGLWWWQQKDFMTPVVQPKLSDASPGKPSLAVLPFANLSDDKNQEYFADGMTDDLITDLSKVSGLIVIARNSVFTYKGRAVKVQDVARDLNVTHVLEGSVRRAGGKVRINAQLILASTGAHLWAEKFDRDFQDVFALEDEVTGKIVEALRVKLTPVEKTNLARKPTGNLEAYDLYLRARQAHFERTVEGSRTALALYEQSIAKDPTFAEAFAGIAIAATDVWRFDFDSVLLGPIARLRAFEAAQKAIQLDPVNASAHAVLGLLGMVDGDHEDAMRLARKAVKLAPNDAEARVALATVLTYAGAHEEALEEMETAFRLSPAPPPHFYGFLGSTLFFNRLFDRAATALEKLRALQSPGWPQELAMVYAQLNRLGNPPEN
ncbi:MAG: tetratricopeptide repeat protein [Rhodospirillaceae bacterium]|nr:tetratricopeptide repeat protein [Rhodospirillaceae bacterium]